MAQLKGDPGLPSRSGATVRRPEDRDLDFTLEHYAEILAAIKENHETLSFRDVSYVGRDLLKLDRFVIMRHDVEISLTAALRLAELDHAAGIRSTFFLLYSSDYNIFEPSGAAIVRRILDLGHDIGLHYDLQAYDRMGADPAVVARRQIELMESYWDTKIYAMSCHLPMRTGRTLSLPGVIDVYDPLFIDDIKYVSDSTQRWREGVVTSLLAKHDKIHLLTHELFWSEQGHTFDVVLREEPRRKYAVLAERADATVHMSRRPRTRVGPDSRSATRSEPDWQRVSPSFQFLGCTPRMVDPEV